MTATARHDDPSVTDSGNVRMRVRNPKNRSVVPIRPGMDPGFAYTRAIPRSPEPDKTHKPSKIRDFVSPHLGEVKAPPELVWLTRELPETLEQVATTLIPAGVRNPAVWSATFLSRLFKLAVHFAAYTACAATRTDKRAGVALAITVLTITAVLTYTNLTGH